MRMPQWQDDEVALDRLRRPVAPDLQRRGVGRRLMAKVERAAREAGVTTLVVSSSVTAKSFYARLGFKAIRDQYYGEERTIIMERDLTPVSWSQVACGIGTFGKGP